MRRPPARTAPPWWSTDRRTGRPGRAGHNGRGLGQPGLRQELGRLRPASGNPHFGNCYATWDDFGNGNLILMSTSTDGGHLERPGADGQQRDRTRRAARRAAGRRRDRAGGQRVRDGDHRLPLDQRRRRAGAARPPSRRRRRTTWPATCAAARCHRPRSTGPDGPTWCGRTAASAGAAGQRHRDDHVVRRPELDAGRRVPIDSATSSVNHFIPGIGVDVTTSG